MEWSEIENIIKKNKEYKILRKVYTNEKIKIKLSEEPDFIIEYKMEKFGVEITEYYYNEASARLKNYKGYTEKILKSDSSDVLNKRDKGVIEKVRFIYKRSKRE